MRPLAAPPLALVLVLLTIASCKRREPSPVGEASPSPPSSSPEGRVFASPPNTIPIDYRKRASSGEPAPVILITLARDGVLTVDGKVVPESAIPKLVAHAHERYPDDMQAVLRIDGDVPHKDVIRLIDLVKQNGISMIALGMPLPPGDAAP